MQENERKLTKAEIKRKEMFENTVKELEKQGYKRYDRIISVVKANVMATVVMLPFVVIMGIVYFTINKIEYTDRISFSFRITLMPFLVLVLFVVLHEIIHGFVWGCFAENHFKSIQFGVIWKYLTPYCTCSQPLNKWQYAIGGAMPTLILGFGLCILSAVWGSLSWFILGEIMIMCGGGDFMVLIEIFKYKSKSKDVLLYDHPYECGFVVFEK